MRKTRDFHQLFISPEAYWAAGWAVPRDGLDLGDETREEIVHPFVYSVNKHCTDRPCQELRRKLPACDNTNYRCSGDFSSGRSTTAVPAGENVTLSGILHNFPQPFEENSGTLPERFLPNSFSVKVQCKVVKNTTSLLSVIVSSIERHISAYSEAIIRFNKC
jgi:hypothetical protein